MPVAKIIILNWNGADHLRRFLPSVVPAGVEVIVADNGSTDDSLAALAAGFPSVTVLRMDRNYGFAGGYNRALEYIEADYYLLLNSDVETPEGWLAPILDCLDRNPDVAVAAPKLISCADRTEGLPGALSTSWAIPSAGGASCAAWRRTGASTTTSATFSG